jgi:hypothetical protein
VKKASVLYNAASEYSDGIAEFFGQNFEEMGGRIVAFESYPAHAKTGASLGLPTPTLSLQRKTR